MAGSDVYLPIISVHISKAPASYEAWAGLFPYTVSELSMPCSEGSGDSITPLFFKTGRCPYNPHTKKNRTQNRSLTNLCVLFGCFALTFSVDSDPPQQFFVAHGTGCHTQSRFHNVLVCTVQTNAVDQQKGQHPILQNRKSCAIIKVQKRSESNVLSNLQIRRKRG